MVPLDLDYPTMLHDFGLTQRHAVFIQTSMRFRLLHCLKPGKSVFAYDDKAPLRFLVLPRNATSAR
jgi:carotenoid cleavage dioxygenase-like enzyme